jgi:hypothetical protein
VMLADVDDRLKHDPRQRDSGRSVMNARSVSYRKYRVAGQQGVIAYRLRTEK